MKKIIINERGDFKIQLDDNRFVGKNWNARIFTSDEDLTELVNPNIIEKLESAEVLEYVPPAPLPFNDVKFVKISLFRNKRDSILLVDGKELDISDLNRYNELLPSNDVDLGMILSVKTFEISGYIVDTLEKVKSLRQSLAFHVFKYDEKIKECESATTQTELDAVLDD
jgi:hypothetical protein